MSTTAQHKPAQIGAPSGLGLKRVLLVDDQAHVLRVMKLTLDRNGYEVDTALNGETALALMSEHHYDVLVTDLDMPHMDGRALCEEVYSLLGEKAPLIFVVTSSENDNDLGWLESHENLECLDKPVSLRWLVARLSEYFGHFDTAVSV
ncbi:MAG: response regulator [Gammaproteobacteria bacterium]|nr:response regulator [Gammaproteobacteria bacterium]